MRSNQQRLAQQIVEMNSNNNEFSEEYYSFVPNTDRAIQIKPNNNKFNGSYSSLNTTRKYKRNEFDQMLSPWDSQDVGKDDFTSEKDFQCQQEEKVTDEDDMKVKKFILPIKSRYFFGGFKQNQKQIPSLESLNRLVSFQKEPSLSKLDISISQQPSSHRISLTNRSYQIPNESTIIGSSSNITETPIKQQSSSGDIKDLQQKQRTQQCEFSPRFILLSNRSSNQQNGSIYSQKNTSMNGSIQNQLNSLQQNQSNSSTQNQQNSSTQTNLQLATYSQEKQCMAKKGNHMNEGMIFDQNLLPIQTKTYSSSQSQEKSHYEQVTAAQNQKLSEEQLMQQTQYLASILCKSQPRDILLIREHLNTIRQNIGLQLTGESLAKHPEVSKQNRSPPQKESKQLITNVEPLLPKRMLVPKQLNEDNIYQVFPKVNTIIAEFPLVHCSLRKSRSQWIKGSSSSPKQVSNALFTKSDKLDRLGQINKNNSTITDCNSLSKDSYYVRPTDDGLHTKIHRFHQTKKPLGMNNTLKHILQIDENKSPSKSVDIFLQMNRNIKACSFERISYQKLKKCLESKKEDSPNKTISLQSIQANIKPPVNSIIWKHQQQMRIKKKKTEEEFRQHLMETLIQYEETKI